MGITAIALLRIPNLAKSGISLSKLEDAVLLDTQASFADDPEELSQLVREQLGDAADAHADPRGIFFLPHVAAPKARNYEGVIAEVGEGGVWGPLPSALPQLGAALAGGSLGALLGGLMQQMPSGFLDSVGAAMRAQPEALEAASSQLKAAASSGELAGLAGKLTQDKEGLDMSKLGALLEGSGIDMNAMSRLVGEVQTALAKDPAATAKLAEQLFAQMGGDDEAEDESDEDEGADPNKDA